LVIGRADSIHLCELDLPIRIPAILRHTRSSQPLGAKGRIEGLVAVPLWGRWGGINDRFAFGDSPGMHIYMQRGELAWQALLTNTHPRNGEHLLRTQLRGAHRISVRHTAAVTQRFRPTGTGPRDIVGLFDDSIEYLRDDLQQVVAKRKNKHWWSTAGKLDRNTTLDVVCGLSRRAVAHMGSWSTAAGPNPIGAYDAAPKPMARAVGI